MRRVRVGETGQAYGGHINSQATLRSAKARKIEAILARRIDLATVEMLDLGAGSGLLAAHFKPLVARITAADREPEAFLPGDIEIVETPEAALPFPDASFDLVVFNHVIEHVGERPDQARMLAEIARVLRPGGLLYLAVPNRWTLREPHYGLYFLSWLPRGLADRYIRAKGRGDWYDCRPFSQGEIRRAMAAHFEIEDATSEAFYDLLSIEKSGRAVGRVLARAPRWLVDAAGPAMPTFVILGRKPAAG